MTGLQGEPKVILKNKHFSFVCKASIFKGLVTKNILDDFPPVSKDLLGLQVNKTVFSGVTKIRLFDRRLEMKKSLFLKLILLKKIY